MPDVTSMKLSIPKPTSEMLPANVPATKATRPSRLFQAMVKYSKRFPRSATTWRSSEISTMDRIFYAPCQAPLVRCRFNWLSVL